MARGASRGRGFEARRSGANDADDTAESLTLLLWLRGGKFGQLT
jgi:hypothetical protein